jgi:BMFP domain-containing protein YqiC
MQFDNRIIDDLARAASGMLSTLGSVRAEFEAQFRSGIERLLKSYDLVTREELEAVKAMAAKARTDAEELKLRVAALEERLAAAAPASAPNGVSQGGPEALPDGPEAAGS